MASSILQVESQHCARSACGCLIIVNLKSIYSQVYIALVYTVTVFERHNMIIAATFWENKECNGNMLQILFTGSNATSYCSSSDVI